MKLTARQREVLEFIHQRVREDGLPPTRAEIVAHFRFASPNAAQCHLRALAERGAIELRPGRARGIVPLALERASDGDAPTTDDKLPLIGRVAAGSPLLAIENHEDEIRIDARLFSPRPDYALRVSGDSMIGAGIAEGDLLLVHRTPEALSGQIVVARLDEEVTVKRLRRRNGQIVLEPENPDHRPVTIERGTDLTIEGLGVGVLRPRLQ